MSLKKTAFKIALGFAAAKGYDAYRRNGGMEGVKRMVSDARRSGGSGGTGLGGLLGALGSGGGTAGATGGVAGLLGGLSAMAGTPAGGTGAEVAARVEAAPTDEATAGAMLRAIGQAVRADGVIDDAERAILRDMLDDAETEADRAALEAALTEPVHAEALARDVPRGAEAQVYAAALTAIDPDHPGEVDFLRRLAAALVLTADEVARLHGQAGKPL